MTASVSPNPSYVQFSIIAHAAWAPGLDSPEAWQKWQMQPHAVTGTQEPSVLAMPAMLRRRAGPLAKMALEVAYQCCGARHNIPLVFCSRHGDVVRSVAMLEDLANDDPLSPTAFGLSVHNATGGLWSIARAEHAAQSALAGGCSTAEHGVIEACGILGDGAEQVMLVVADAALPMLYHAFDDDHTQSFAWAWLLQSASRSPSDGQTMTLAWTRDTDTGAESTSDATLPGGLAIWRFFLGHDQQLIRRCNGRRWMWRRNA